LEDISNPSRDPRSIIFKYLPSSNHESAILKTTPNRIPMRVYKAHEDRYISGGDPGRRDLEQGHFRAPEIPSGDVPLMQS